MTNKYSHLHFVPYKNLGRWDIKNYISQGLSSQYKMVVLGNYIHEESTKYNISDKSKEYGILGVNNQTGIFDAYRENGAKIHQKYKRMKDGWIAYNPYRVNVGSIGIKLKMHQYEYISPAYVVFSCKKELLPEFLFLLMKSQTFNRIIRENTTGSVRQNLSYARLSSVQIPLPSLEEQHALVRAYQKNLDKASLFDNKVFKGEKMIADFIMQSLGIIIPKDEIERKGISFVSYKEIKDRWDMYNVKSSIFAVLSMAKYKSVQIGKAYQFITRSWRKIEDKFRYVEIGAVDAMQGITSATELLTKKAPSRATQKVKLGDLIIGTTRPYLKKYSIISEEYEDCVCSSGFQVISNTSDNNLIFLLEYLRTPAAIAQYDYFMTGALYPAITSSDLKKLEIPLPPLNVQEKIVEDVLILRAKMRKDGDKAARLRQDAITKFEQTIFE